MKEDLRDACFDEELEDDSPCYDEEFEDESPCYECRRNGDDYSPEDGELVCNCLYCQFNDWFHWDEE